MGWQDSNLIDNQESNRFEIPCENSIFHMSYKRTKNTIELFHCDSCNGIDNLELMDELISLVLEYIKTHGLKLIPSCPYVALYIMKNAEWREYVIE